jgi:hypothetical protein
VKCEKKFFFFFLLAVLATRVHQSVATFQTLSARILETHHSNNIGHGQFPPPEGGPSNIYFQDVFQDLRFDPDNLLFEKDDMTWLSSFESAQ